MRSPQRERQAPRISFASSWCSPVCSAAALNHELASDIWSTVEKQCGQRPLKVRETTAAPGQTNRHFRVDLKDGSSMLVKAARPQTAPDVAQMRFLGEQTALEWLRRYSGSLVVPRSLGVGGTRTALSLIEWVDLAPFGLWMEGGQAILGKSIAELHTSSMTAGNASQQFGFGVDTYLGELRLDNNWDNDWVRFFVEKRLTPRLQDALLRVGSQYGTSNEDANALRAVAERVQDVGRVRWALFDRIRVVPALLHGDLFSGNCGIRKVDRGCVMFDPASYWGHSELDLAVSTLFGRFKHEFYDAYHSVQGRENGFEGRRVLYRFYYLLNLLVQHGGGYGAGGSTENPKGYFEMCCEHAVQLKTMLE